MSKIIIPEFLKNIEILEEQYLKWLKRKSVNIANRDRKKNIKVDNYIERLHKAVEISEGKDFYTGDMLDWHLISQYDNKESKSGGRAYMKKFAKLPTIDHEYGTTIEFRICGWLTNDCKNHLNYEELIEFCRKVSAHAESSISASDT